MIRKMPAIAIALLMSVYINANAQSVKTAQLTDTSGRSAAKMEKKRIRAGELLRSENAMLAWRDSGWKAWQVRPHDPKRFKWLIKTVHMPPAYWLNKAQGAAGNAESTIYEAPVNWQAIQAWNAAYGKMRVELMASEEVTPKDKQAFLNSELYGLLVSRLNKARNYYGKLDVSETAALVMAAGQRSFTDTVKGYDAPAEALLGYMELPFLYGSAYGWNPDDLQQLVNIISNSGVARLQQWARQKNELLALRTRPLQFSATAMDGRTVDLSALRGKFVLIDYWATTCTVCIERMNQIRDVVKQYRPKGLEVVSVSLNRNTPRERELMLAIKHRAGVEDWTTVVAGSAEGDSVRLDRDIFYRFGFVGIPQLLLLDKKGLLVAINGELGSGNIEPLLQKLMLAGTGL